MDQIPRYIKNKNNPENIVYTHKALEPILKVTNGCMVYQEQVMQIFRDLAGYSLGRADLVRRAMGKKKLDVMKKEREIFIQGALKNGIDEESSNKIFDEMEEFAKYAFNKSHAAAYAVVAYKTAYLKAHFKAEFMAATMNSFIGNLNKIPEYIEECKDMGIEVLKPDINESYLKFSVINGKIRFALSSIKNAGDNAINEIITSRKNFGKYTSFIDFCERVSGESVNKKCVESLIKAGCFDEIEPNLTRFDLLDSFESILDNITQTKRNNYANQINMFDMGDIDKNTPTVIINKSNKKPTKKDLLDMEKEMLGLYVSGHPLDEYMDVIKKEATVTSKDLENEEQVDDIQELENKTDYDGKVVTVCGILSHRKNLITKSGNQMMFAELEDLYGSLELIIFANVLQNNSSLLQDDNIVKIIGKVSYKENEKTKIIVSQIQLLEKNKKLYIRIPKDKLELEGAVISYIKNIGQTYRGNIPVYIFYDGTKKVKLLNRSLWLNSNEDTLKKLETAFGAENVRIK